MRTTQNESNLLVSTMTDGPNFLIGGRIIHLPSPGPAASYPSMTLRSFRIAQPGVVQQTWQAQVPKDIEFGTAIASPDNRLLLWSCSTSRHTSLSEWLHRLFSERKIVTVVKTNWFLSDLQGKNMHPILEDVIGNDALFQEDDGRTDSPTLSFSWTPDSKHLSFLYKRQLYFVPVD